MSLQTFSWQGWIPLHSAVHSGDESNVKAVLEVQCGANMRLLKSVERVRDQINHRQDLADLADLAASVIDSGRCGQGL